MTEWILIIGGIVLGLVLATHAAGVGFIASRVFISGRKKLKQFSPDQGGSDHLAHDA